ncbi:WhiB family transcriptional regulator [Rhodococcus qingshengii]|uniref:WhiB family transcriptional regulator n=1 Tax=Rhodococcus qingshengii TaxID=334542 RepID=UPI0029435337|nr:WhiB family transcriptional regulator [Rhodococcus qingshengii]WOI90139.1 WhiB family transcriptional regulator [Rhodococcus qingshengii]
MFPLEGGASKVPPVQAGGTELCLNTRPGSAIRVEFVTQRRERPCSCAPTHLPRPLADEWDWQLSGTCRDTDPALFYDDTNERGSRRAKRESSAKLVCARCPVVQRCLVHAIQTGEPHGIWGGMTATERESLRKARTEPLISAATSSRE